LLGFAAVASRLGQSRRAARLFAAAGALQAASGAVIMPAPRALYEREVAALRANLDEAAFAAAQAQGASMSLEQALDYALEGGSGGK
jgi:hypothetical protein